jgi:rhodanese-related sulfurtransferase
MKQTAILTCLLASVALAAGGCKKDESKSSENKNKDEAPAAAVDKSANSAKSDKAADMEPVPGDVAVDELATLIEADKVSVFDANGAKVREKYGKIPSAKLLSSYDYKLDELPADKKEKLVFYCSNTQCSAAPSAAKKAMIAGYTDVNVLPVGVMGWKEAGKNTETVQ